MRVSGLACVLIGISVSGVSIADRISGTEFSDYYQKVLVERGFENSTAGFVAALGHSDPTIRLFAAQALGERRDPAAITALIGALSDGSATVRYHVARSLVALQSGAGQAVLKEALLSNANAAESVEAAGLLAELGDPSGYPQVLRALKSSDSSVRMRSLAELGKFRRFEGLATDAGRIDIVGAFSSVLASATDSATRVNAAYALARTGDRRGRTALSAAAASSDKALANAAQVGLTMLGAAP